MLLEAFTIGLALICVSSLLGGFYAGLQKTAIAPDSKQQIFKRVSLLLLAWIGIFGTLAAQGTFTDFSSFPPKLLAVPVAPIFMVIALSYSQVFKEVIRHIPYTWLIGFQAFRVLVEIILWAMFTREMLPEQMTFEGRNFDILVGITAPITAWLIYKNAANRKLVLIWNLFGLALLINIVGIAILSMPSPIRQFFNEPANTIVAVFPFVFIPGIYVPVAYTLHIFSLRKWWLERKIR